jgi:hypothetical protein
VKRSAKCECRKAKFSTFQFPLSNLEKPMKEKLAATVSVLILTVAACCWMGLEKVESRESRVQSFFSPRSTQNSQPYCTDGSCSAAPDQADPWAEILDVDPVAAAAGPERSIVSRRERPRWSLLRAGRQVLGRGISRRLERRANRGGPFSVRAEARLEKRQLLGRP